MDTRRRWKVLLVTLIAAETGCLLLRAPPAGVTHGDEAVNDEFDVCYEYLQGRTTGVIRLIAPAEPGRWDVRMHDTDGNGREVASLTFSVVPGR